ncbi:MAG TPA: peptidoglycan-binding protein [Pyrinomonadaceae bacterium]|jgi:predicted chitinase|nr:peptidoglycan-binding protein [Pyrinomonadaceae bacterium]
MLTDDELRQIMPNCPAARRADYLPFIQQAMAEFDINSYLRETAFLAQLAHESAELRYMEEIASGAAYEGRANLGNTQPGDGKRFKGRGPIQLTGRANYTRYGQLLGLDLVNNPTIAATKEVGFRIAGQFWRLNGLNELADQEDFRAITKRINGGYNGLQDRIKYYERAKNVLSKDDNGSPATAAGGIPPCPNPFLRQGSQGNAVRALQQRLSALGYQVSVDGSFGPGTCAAVKACQEKNGLSSDGVVGPSTWKALWT